jgi:hypothetical protein
MCYFNLVGGSSLRRSRSNSRERLYLRSSSATRVGGAGGFRSLRISDFTDLVLGDFGAIRVHRTRPIKLICRPVVEPPAARHEK